MAPGPGAVPITLFGNVLYQGRLGAFEGSSPFLEHIMSWLRVPGPFQALLHRGQS